MKDYIERDKALNASKIVYIEYIELDYDGYEEADADNIPIVLKKDIEAIPAADVRPIVRGEWLLEFEPNGKPYCYHCSVCDGDFHYIGIKTKYDFCPNCGADMEIINEENENET